MVCGWNENACFSGFFRGQRRENTQNCHISHHGKNHVYAPFRRNIPKRKKGAEHVPKRRCDRCYATGVAKVFRKRLFRTRKREKTDSEKRIEPLPKQVPKRHLKAVPERCAELPVLWKNTRQKAEKPKVGYHIIYKKKLISVLFGNKAAEKDDGRTLLSEFRKFETGEKNGGFGRKRSKYE